MLVAQIGEGEFWGKYVTDTTPPLFFTFKLNSLLFLTNLAKNKRELSQLEIAGSKLESDCIILYSACTLSP